jgi:IS30 family transposase
MSNRLAIQQRREKLWVLLTRGMKGYEIARKLGVDAGTVSKDIKYLVSQSQGYIDSLARETLPFMYQQSIEGVRDILKECWKIYETSDEKNDNRIAALALAKQCYESMYKLTSEGPTVAHLKFLEEKLNKIEQNR